VRETHLLVLQLNPTDSADMQAAAVAGFFIDTIYVSYMLIFGCG